MVDIVKKDEKGEDDRLIETVDLDQLVEGNPVFESRGVSRLKVTRGGVVRQINIPIKSRGVGEMIEEFERTERPQPPRKRELVKKDSDLGRQMKLTKNEFFWVFDLTDEEYLKGMEKYSRDLGLKIIMFALDFPIKDRDGNEIRDDERKLDVLKGMGLTKEHLEQLIDDIQSLTQWQEDRENDFLER